MPGTVTFHLTSPDPDFLFKLALPFAAAVPSGSPEPDVGGRALPATGPYMIEQYRPDRTLALVRNPRFREWSADAQPAGYPDRLVWKFGVAQKTATTMVEHGRADIMIDAPPEQRLPEIARRFPSQAHPFVRAATSYYLFLNTRLPPFDDVRVRRALNFAVDQVGNRAPVGRHARATDVPTATSRLSELQTVLPVFRRVVGDLDCARPHARSTASPRREGD